MAGDLVGRSRQTCRLRDGETGQARAAMMQAAAVKRAIEERFGFHSTRSSHSLPASPTSPPSQSFHDKRDVSMSAGGEVLEPHSLPPGTAPDAQVCSPQLSSTRLTWSAALEHARVLRASERKLDHHRVSAQPVLHPHLLLLLRQLRFHRSRLPPPARDTLPPSPSPPRHNQEATAQGSRELSCRHVQPHHVRCKRPAGTPSPLLTSPVGSPCLRLRSSLSVGHVPSLLPHLVSLRCCAAPRSAVCVADQLGLQGEQEERPAL
eukprot:88581-Hanusia_phi.AAC.2